MIELYTFGNSVCCQKVRIVLAEKGLDFVSHEVNLFTNAQYNPDYLTLNPSGVVPTLVHDSEVVTESTVICEYLDESYPDPQLMPTSALGKAQVRLWSKMVDEGLHEGVGAISFSAMFRERMRGMTPEQRQARYTNTGDAKKGDIWRDTFEHGANAKWTGYAVGAYERMFKRLETTLAERGPWIMGDAPTLADIALMPYVARLHYLKLLDLWIAGRPHVADWWTRTQAWQSFIKGIAEPMLLHEADEMAFHGPKIRGDLAATLARVDFVAPISGAE